MKETEKCIEKGKRYYEENIERLQKIALDYLKKQKIGKEHTQEIDTKISLKRTDKNKEYIRKIEFEVCPKKNCDSK